MCRTCPVAWRVRPFAVRHPQRDPDAPMSLVGAEGALAVAGTRRLGIGALTTPRSRGDIAPRAAHRDGNFSGDP
jgi:hypothetical protein